MEKLFEYLNHIQSLLDQIFTITDNQTTILLTLTGAEGEAENEALDMVTQMADYKEELTKELSSAEEAFQAYYEAHKELVEGEVHVRDMQSLVKGVLDGKQAVVAQEQKNLLLLQAHSKKKLERVQVPQNPRHAASAYRKQQKKT
ncbi:MAG: hypothetical protein K0R69_1578 [Clostridia bacterium]|jgi:hypothetical protein|nr:hypothetical protein [Clostridia bacterium]